MEAVRPLLQAIADGGIKVEQRASNAARHLIGWTTVALSALVTLGLALAPTTASAEPESTPADPAAVRQHCIDVALAKPEILKAQVMHAGRLESLGKLTESRQDFWFAAKYQPWPEECKGLYGRGGMSWGQALHHGKWVRATSGHGLGILENNFGHWYDLGNGAGIDFPICRARIRLKLNIVDLSVEVNSDIPWKPHHPTIAKAMLAPIPAKVLPHKPKVHGKVKCVKIRKSRRRPSRSA
jgi:hypothetical protein